MLGDESNFEATIFFFFNYQGLPSYYFCVEGLVCVGIAIAIIVVLIYIIRYITLWLTLTTIGCSFTSMRIKIGIRCLSKT